MSKYKLTFKLKQHTPIIHFQHDQHGATLRATELKPKLDRFLIKNAFGGILNFNKYKKYLIADSKTIEKIEKKLEGIDNDNHIKDKDKAKLKFLKEQKLALDYKVRVEPFIEKNIKYYLPLPTQLNSRNYPNKEQNLKIFLLNYISFDFEYLLPTPYFANSDKVKFHRRSENVDMQNSKPDEINFAIYTNDEIDVKVTSFNKEILKAIKENIIEFFLINNFGTRQNKGFGSYTAVSINDEKVSDDTINKLLKTNFIKKTYQQNDINRVFSFILNEYALLKSGTNRPYNKSELFKYFINKNIRWEKRFIKQKLNQNGVLLTKRHDPIDYDESKVPKNVNSDRNYYNDYNDKDEQNNDYKYIRALLGLAENFEFASDNKGRLKVKVKSTDGSVERFKSPLFFKVIDGIVYLKTDETYKNIERKKFQFLYNDNLGTLEVPTGFDLDTFINNHISNKWQNI